MTVPSWWCLGSSAVMPEPFCGRLDLLQVEGQADEAVAEGGQPLALHFEGAAL